MINRHRIFVGEKNALARSLSTFKIAILSQAKLDILNVPGLFLIVCKYHETDTSIYATRNSLMMH